MAGVVPLAPIRLRESTKDRSRTTLGVKWNAPENNGAIRYTYSLSIAWDDQQVTVDGIEELFHVHNVVLGTFYTYEVRAVNAIGASLASNELILQAGTNPCPPSNVRTSLTDAEDLSIITWDPAPCDNGL
jgi:hypothetical protein